MKIEKSRKEERREEERRQNKHRRNRKIMKETGRVVQTESK